MYNNTAAWVASCKYHMSPLTQKEKRFNSSQEILLVRISETASTTEAATHSSNKKDAYKRNAQASENQTNEEVPLDTPLAGSFQHTY